MNPMKKTVALIPALLLALNYSSCQTDSRTAADIASPEKHTDLLFSWAYLKQLYIFQDELPADPYAFRTPQDLFHSLTDPWTEYYTPEEGALLMDYLFSTENEAGIGIFIQSKDSLFYIRKIIPGSPAASSALMNHDTLLAADGITLVGVSRAELSHRLSGSAGSQVTLTVKRNAQNFDVTLTRGPFSIPSVITDALDSDVVYIWATEFTENDQGIGTGEEWENALAATRTYDVTLLDLRSNTGGLLEESIQMASSFLPAHTPIIRTRERDTDERTGITTTRDSLYSSPGVAGTAAARKFVLLVDSMTASASEVVTTAILESRNDIPILGDTTYGKGRGQLIVFGFDGGLAKITAMSIRSGLNVDYNGRGLVPDSLVLADENTVLEKGFRTALQLIGRSGKVAAGPSMDPVADLSFNRRMLGVRPREPLKIIRASR